MTTANQQKTADDLRELAELRERVASLESAIKEKNQALANGEWCLGLVRRVIENVNIIAPGGPYRVAISDPANDDAEIQVLPEKLPTIGDAFDICRHFESVGKAAMIVPAVFRAMPMSRYIDDAFGEEIKSTSCEKNDDDPPNFSPAKT